MHSGLPVEEQLTELREQVQRVINHTDTNRRQREESLASILTDLKAEVSKISIKADVRTADPTPLWAKVAAAAAALITVCFTVFGIAIGYGRNDASVVARIQAVETTVQTSARLRDQQQEGFRDRLRSLEQSDQAGAERIGTVLQSLATITAQLQAQTVRMEEVLRRQDRLENRLGARPGMGDGHEQPTTLHDLRRSI